MTSMALISIDKISSYILDLSAADIADYFFQHFFM